MGTNDFFISIQFQTMNHHLIQFLPPASFPLVLVLLLYQKNHHHHRYLISTSIIFLFVHKQQFNITIIDFHQQATNFKLIAISFSCHYFLSFNFPF